MNRAFPFSWVASGRHAWELPESSPHNVLLLTLPQELLESRLKVLKKDLEDYEEFRSTEEKESKDLLVSMATPRLAPLGDNRGPPATLARCVQLWSVCLWNSRGGF